MLNLFQHLDICLQRDPETRFAPKLQRGEQVQDDSVKQVTQYT